MVELAVYALFSFFCWICFILSYVLPRDGDRVFLKFWSFILFQGLAVFSLSVKYFIPNGSPSSYSVAVEVSEVYQKALLAVYALFGFFQLFMGIWDYLNLEKDAKKERRI